MLKSLGTFFLDMLEVVVFAVGIFFFVYLLIMRPHKIKGQSMHPNFPDSEYLLTEKVTYYFKKPTRGDVIVFMPPISETDEFIKRIIALPGETVAIKNGRIYVNGILLNEPYISDDVKTTGGSFLSEDETVRVPKDEYFVIGDNREHSSDSRSWGPIKKKSISGRAWLVYWPLSNAGTVKLPNYQF